MTLNPKQLVWRCRRGIRELDVLFTRFLDTEYPHLKQAEQQAFQRLLDVQDPTIMEWIFGKTISKDPEIDSIINKLQLISGLNN